MAENRQYDHEYKVQAVLHSDRGSQYTSQLYRDMSHKYGIQQSMNSAGGKCHDNARCESMWARMKSERLISLINISIVTFRFSEVQKFKNHTSRTPIFGNQEVKKMDFKSFGIRNTEKNSGFIKTEYRAKTCRNAALIISFYFMYK